MPGFTLRPVEAKLTHDTELIGKMSPYCEFQLGGFIGKSEVCKRGGKNPHWEDSVSIPARQTGNNILNIRLMDKGTFTKDDVIGGFTLDLTDAMSQGKVSKWYPIYYDKQPAGEILMESIYEEGTLAGEGLGIESTKATFSEDKTSLIDKKTRWNEEGTILTGQKATFRDEKAVDQSGVKGFEPDVKLFHEQRQSVESRTFTKEVDVVETKSVMQNIEVMEPVKVLKDVEYTEVVPVTKQVETIKPQVVKKQIEVIEPQLVTKTIQVVENVPVMKEVEVIESVPVMEEIETLEPKTFTKQVEVTEYAPVKKQVEVTEPVHLKKTVEFVEPVITTQTITKEIRQPVVVNEEITTSVGPATLIAGEKVLKKELGEKQYVKSKFVKEELGGKQFAESDLIKNELDEKLLAEFDESDLSKKTFEGGFDDSERLREKIRGKNYDKNEFADEK